MTPLNWMLKIFFYVMAGAGIVQLLATVLVRGWILSFEWILFIAIMVFFAKLIPVNDSISQEEELSKWDET